MMQEHMADNATAEFSFTSCSPSDVRLYVRDMTLQMVARNIAGRELLKKKLEDVFLGLVYGCSDRHNAGEAVTQACRGVEDALIDFVRATRIALIHVALSENDSLVQDVEYTRTLLSEVEDAFLDAAEDAATYAPRAAQQALLEVLVAARTGGTRLGAVASSARRDIGDQFEYLRPNHAALARWQKSARMAEATRGLLNAQFRHGREVPSQCDGK